MSNKIYFSYEDLEKIICDREILEKIKKAMDKLKGFHKEVLEELSKALGVRVEDFNWDEIEGYMYYDGKRWRRLPKSKYARIIDRIVDKYHDAIYIVDLFSYALRELVQIKTGKEYACYYNDRIDKFVCWR